MKQQHRHLREKEEKNNNTTSNTVAGIIITKIAEQAIRSFLLA
jgi:hypothetical protein